MAETTAKQACEECREVIEAALDVVSEWRRSPHIAHTSRALRRAVSRLGDLVAPAVETEDGWIRPALVEHRNRRAAALDEGEVT